MLGYLYHHPSYSFLADTLLVHEANVILLKTTPLSSFSITLIFTISELDIAPI